MTRGAGSYHYVLREKIKGFETLKEIKDKGLVYDYVTTLGVHKTAFAVGSIEAAKRFYNETLGCPEVTFRSPYFLEIPLFGKRFVAVLIDGYRGPPPIRARTVVQEPCFGVETTAVNFRSFVTRLQQASVPYEYVASPDLEDGRTCCFCEDPAGHRLYVAADVPRPATRRASLQGLDMSAMTQTPYTLQSREDSAKSRYTITPPPPDFTDDADGMRWYPCDRADESLARPIPGTAQREIVAAPPTRARRRSPVRRARTSTDAPPAPWREGVESCDRTIDEFRVMLSKRPAAQPSWRCLHCSTENEPVVDWCRLCRAGRIRVSLAIAS
jgi:extradiol dioxygenase family protein